MTRSTRGNDRRQLRVTIIACGLALLTACRVPEAPEWDIQTTLPVASDTFTWADLLPPFIVTDTVDGREVFAVDLPPRSLEYRLGDLCGLCADLDGQTVTVPPFDFTDSLDITFPDRLFAIEVAESGFDTEVDNQVGFDLLAERNSTDDTPSLILILRDLENLTTLDSIAVGPGTESLPSGSTWSRRLAIVDKTVTRGVRLVVLFHYPGSQAAVQIDTMRSARLIGRLDGAQIPAIVLVVDNEVWDEVEEVDLDQTTRDEIVNRFQGGRVDFVVFHDLAATSTLEMSLASTRAHLFSGDPRNEVSWGGLELASGQIQSFEISQVQLETLATFPEPFYFGYRGVANGMATGPSALKLTRITADQRARVIFRLQSRLRVGK